MSRNTRQTRLRELNRYDTERIMNENIERLLELEESNLDDIDFEEGSVDEGVAQAAAAEDSMAEVQYLTTLLQLSDEGVR